MRNQDRVALDRLIAEQKAKDAEREAKRKRRQEHKEWQRTPMCSWTTYFIILAVLSPIVFIAACYVPDGPPDLPSLLVVSLWAFVSIMQIYPV